MILASCRRRISWLSYSSVITCSVESSAAQRLCEGWAEGFGLRNVSASAGQQLTNNDTDPLETEDGSNAMERLLKVSVLGAPNAGKSTIVNQLVGSKVSAVSNRTNTTQTPMLGAFTEGRTQVLLTDTPGILDSRHEPTKHTDHFRQVKSAWKTLEDSHLGLFVVDAFRQWQMRDPRVLRLVSEYEGRFKQDQPVTPLLLVLNKIDKLDEGGWKWIDSLSNDLNSRHSFESTFLVSAKDERGLPALKTALLSRGHIFNCLRQELPYRLKVVAAQESHRNLPGGSVTFNLLVLTPSESVRRMVIGARGSVIGRIGIAAREELCTVLKKKSNNTRTIRRLNLHKRCPNTFTCACKLQHRVEHYICPHIDHSF